MYRSAKIKYHSHSPYRCTGQPKKNIIATLRTDVPVRQNKISLSHSVPMFRSAKIKYHCHFRIDVPVSQNKISLSHSVPMYRSAETKYHHHTQYRCTGEPKQNVTVTLSTDVPVSQNKYHRHTPYWCSDKKKISLLRSAPMFRSAKIKYHYHIQYRCAGQPK